MPHNFSDIPISTGPALVLSPLVAGWVIVRWIAGVAALVGILETIRFAILIPQVFAIIGPIIGTRWHADYWIAVAGVLSIAINGAAAMCVMWGAWWCFMREPAAARLLRRGCIGLLCVWLGNFAAGFLPQVQAAQPKGYFDEKSVVNTVIIKSHQAVRDIVLPGMLLAFAWSSACGVMLGGGTEQGVAPAFDEMGASPDKNPATNSNMAALRHVVRVLAGVAIALGLPSAFDFIVRHILRSYPLGWPTRPMPIAMFLQALSLLFHDLAAFLLVVSGIALLLEKSPGRRLAIIGAATCLTGKLLGAFWGAPHWDVVVLMIFFDLKIIVAAIFLIAVLTRQPIRESIDLGLRRMALKEQREMVK